MLNLMQQENYQILSTENLKKILKKNGRTFDFDYQLETNKAFIFVLKDTSVLFYPNNPDAKEGFLFKNKSVLDKMIIDDFFPLQFSLGRYLHDKYITEIKELNIDYFRNFLFSTHLFKKDKDKKIEDIYNTFLHSKNKKWELAYAISILVMEDYKLKHNAKWLIVKRYGPYNPYFEPYLYTNDGRVFDVFYIMFTSLMKSKFPLDGNIRFLESNYKYGIPFKNYYIID